MDEKQAHELVITRIFDGPVNIVFEAWTKPELLKRWWSPKSSGMALLSCETDVRVGGKYRFAFGAGDIESLVFFGRYVEVIPEQRLVWTNEESDNGALTTVSFEEENGKTVMVLREAYPSKEALDGAAGMEAGMAETFSQLDELLIILGAETNQS